MSAIFGKIRKKIVPLICLGGVAAVLALPQAASAQSQNGSIRIDRIHPAPAYDASETDFSRIARRYFDVVGPLDFRFDERVVVADRNFPIARGSRITRARQGDYVGIKLNEAGEVVEIRRLRRPPRE